jgi:uncharacterized protein (DUF1786 family)
MAISVLVAGMIMAQAPSAAATDVAFDELSKGQNVAAIARIEANDTLAHDDPARLINLGIAHAREGNDDAARTMFRAAARSESSVRLETATGAWIESRDLARMALAMLDRGQFAPTARVAAR